MSQEKPRPIYLISLRFTNTLVRSVIEKFGLPAGQDSLSEFHEIMCFPGETSPVSVEVAWDSHTTTFVYISNEPTSALSRFCVSLENLFDYNCLYQVGIDQVSQELEKSKPYSCDGVKVLHVTLDERFSSQAERFSDAFVAELQVPESIILSVPEAEFLLSRAQGWFYEYGDDAEEKDMLDNLTERIEKK